jgi:hypothetical protein
MRLPKLTLVIRLRPFKFILIIGYGDGGSGESPASHGRGKRCHLRGRVIA